MDQNNANHLENIFFAALDIHDLEARASYLNETCGQDAELRQRVEQMLAIQSKVGSFMENPPVSFAGTIDLDKKILDAGLTAGLREDHAVVIGSANHSVLKCHESCCATPKRSVSIRLFDRAPKKFRLTLQIVGIDLMAKSPAVAWEPLSKDVPSI
jgi:hypothetical protein